MSLKALFLLSLILVSFQVNGEDLRLEFTHPPVESRPQTWWHWVNGNISKSGITKDLEAMQQAGIGGVTIFNVAGDYPQGNIIFGTTAWNDMFNFAVSEANRLGMSLGFMNCDGWGTSGGPSITPELAMKKITFSEKIVTGGLSFSDTLPKPISNHNYYKDIAVFACPTSENRWNIRQSNVQISSSTTIKNSEKLIDNNFTDYCQINATDKIENQYLQFQFDKSFSTSSLLLFSVFRYNPTHIEIQYSDNGVNYHSLQIMECPSYLSELKFPTISARFFRVYFKSVQYYMAEYSNELRLIECAFLQTGEQSTGLPMINQWELKSGLWFNYDYPFVKSDNSKTQSIFSQKEWINLTSNMNASGVLKWKVPAGNWKIIRIGYTLTGAENGPASIEGRGLECDKLDKTGIRAQFNAYVSKMASNNKSFIGKGLNFALIDSYEAGPQNWTKQLPAEFKKRRGYNLTPWLPVLAGQTVNSVQESERFLWDYRRTLADLMGENYYGEMQKLCATAGLKFHAEAANPEGTPVCDPLLFSSKTDVPMCEFWTLPVPAIDLDFKINNGPDGSFKDVISAAHIYNKPIVAAESFSSFVGNWQHHPSMLKAQGDFALSQGINRIVFHSYTHQPDETVPGWQLNPWGIAINRKQTWWQMGLAWFEYLGRCQHLLQKGIYIADALVLTHEGTSSTLRNSYGKNVFTLLPKGYNYDACNADVLSRAKVINAKIVLDNGNHYALLVLPDNKEMSVESLRVIEKLIAQGAVIYGAKPTVTPGLLKYKANNKKLKAYTDKIWGCTDDYSENRKIYGKGKVFNGINLNQLFENINLKPDFCYASPSKCADIQFIHKRVGTNDIYFLSNQSKYPVELICKFRIKAKAPEIWNPANGTTQSVGVYTFSENETIMPLRLEDSESTFVVFSQKAQNSIVSLSRNGVSLFPTLAEDSVSVQTKTYNIVQDSALQWNVFKTGKYDYQMTDGSKHSLNVPLIPPQLLISGKWMVSFEKGHNAPEEVEFDSLVPLNKHTNPQIKYFSGVATYTKEINLEQSFFNQELDYFLQLEEVHNMASVKINEVEMGVVWLKPYAINVSKVIKTGINKIEIKVATNWANRIIGDLQLPGNERTTWSNTLHSYSGWGNQNKLYTPNSPLVNSGLVGQVLLKSVAKKSTFN